MRSISWTITLLEEYVAELLVKTRQQRENKLYVTLKVTCLRW